MKLVAAIAAVALGGGAVLPTAASLLRQTAPPQPQGSAPGRNRTADAEKPAGTVQRARLDVGFGDFEKKMLAQVTTRIRGGATGKDWTQDLQERCASNVTAELSRGLKEQLAPLKKSIGKTWMALPQDEQKNAYVDQLKTAFLPVMDSYAKTIDGHLNISLHRITGYKLKQESKELLKKCQSVLTDSVAGEHCYEDSPKKGSAKQPAKRAVAMAQTAEQEASQFCIPSIMQGLAHRLNDTQGLISMSMRFDAGAMALAQKGSRKPAAK